jgi:ketosteroid isomerase-like protein
MKTLMLIALVLGIPSAVLAETAAEAAVRAAHDAFVKAAREGDGAALEKILADGLQYSHSNANLENKQQAIAALMKSKSNFEIHAQTIHVYGNTATIRARMTAHLPSGDIPLAMLQVWVKKGKDWQMVERHTTRIPAP